MSRYTIDEMEIWKDIKGYEGKYQISSFGRVKSLKRKTNNQYCKKDHFLKQFISDYGYLRVTLKKNKILKTYTVHKLVLNVFLGYEKLQGNHINGIKTDNRLENLEYCTQSENQIHAYKTGLQKKGADKKIICNETGKIYNSLKSAANDLNTTNQNICHVLKGRSKHAKGYTFNYMEGL
jgi:hypothetical protein